MNVLVLTRTGRSAMLRPLVALATTLLATVLLIGTGVPAADAHTELEQTWPSAGATVRDVAQVRLRFGEPLMEGLAQVAVTGPGGSVEAGDPVVTGSEVVVPLRRPTDAGRYRVAYRVVAADGHTAVGEFAITLATPPARAAEKQRAGADEPSTGPEGAGSARGPRPGAPEPMLPASSGAPVAPGGLDLAVPGGGVAALLLLLGLHLVLRRNGASAGRNP